MVLYYSFKKPTFCFLKLTRTSQNFFNVTSTNACLKVFNFAILDKRHHILYFVILAKCWLHSHFTQTHGIVTTLQSRSRAIVSERCFRCFKTFLDIICLLILQNFEFQRWGWWEFSLSNLEMLVLLLSFLWYLFMIKNEINRSIKSNAISQSLSWLCKDFLDFQSLAWNRSKAYLY